MPQVIGYGVSIPTENGVICIGGEWKDNIKNDTNTHLSDKVFAISYRDGEITVDVDYPDLPNATTAAAGTAVFEFH